MAVKRQPTAQEVYAELQVKVADLRHAISDAPRVIERFKEKLHTAEIELQEASLAWHKEKAEQEGQIGDQKAAELIETAKEIDAGETAEALDRLQKLCGELRFLKRLGASYEAQTMCIARLRKLPMAAGMPPMKHKTFEALARSWLPAAETAAAAA